MTNEQCQQVVEMIKALSNIIDGIGDVNTFLIELAYTKPPLSEAEQHLLNEFASYLNNTLENTKTADKIGTLLYNIGAGLMN